MFHQTGHYVENVPMCKERKISAGVSMRVAAGEPLALTEAQRELFERDVVVHCKRLYLYLLSRCKDSELSHDMLQDTLLSAQKCYARGEYKEGVGIWFWLQKIAKNKLASHFRSKNKQNSAMEVHKILICDNLGWSLPEAQLRAETSGLEDGPVLSRRDKVSQNLEMFLQTGFSALALTEEEKKLLCDRHVHQKAFKELAFSLGQPLSTVMSRYYSVMKRLQREIFAWESEGFLDKELSKAEMRRVAKIRRLQSKLYQLRPYPYGRNKKPGFPKGGAGSRDTKENPAG